MTPLAGPLGFQPLPIGFFAALAAMVVVYLALVEAGKRWFYTSLPTPAPIERWRAHPQRVHRRAARFTHHRRLQRPAAHPNPPSSRALRPLPTPPPLNDDEGMTVTRSRRPPTGRLEAASSRLALAVLHSPLRFLLDPGICELSYTGRRTGQPIRLPVIYAHTGNTVAILSGASDAKTWWRNFTTPQPVRLRIRARQHAGTAVVVNPGTPEFNSALTLYTGRYRDMSFQPGDRLLAITLQPRPGQPLPT